MNMKVQPLFFWKDSMGVGIQRSLQVVPLNSSNVFEFDYLHCLQRIIIYNFQCRWSVVSTLLLEKVAVFNRIGVGSPGELENIVEVREEKHMSIPTGAAVYFWSRHISILKVMGLNDSNP